MSKIAENNLHTSKVEDKDFETLMDLMKETIGSAKYVVGFLKVIFDFNTNSQPTESPSKELNFAHGDVTTDENENTEKDNYDNDDLDESAGSLYDSFEEVHFFETPKNISKRKKCRNLAGSSSFEDSLNTSCDNESLAVEMFGANKVLGHDFNEEESDDKAAVSDDPDPLIMSYADICKINAPVYETPQVKVKDASSWRNNRNEVNVSELGFDNTRDNLEDTAEPLETKIDEEAFSQEFYEFAVKGNDQAKTLPILEVTPSPFLEDLESEVPGTPCLPSSARSSASSRTSDIGEEGFRFRQKEPEVNDPETPKRVFEEESVSVHSTVAGANSNNIVTPNLKQDLESCVNFTQDLKISRKLSMLDQEKFLLEPISPIISVEPKSPNLSVQQISPAPTSSITGDSLHLVSITEEDHIQQQFTAIKDSSPDFRFHKQSLPSPVVGDDRPITPVSATNSTFITDQSIPANNSTFNNSLLNYREPKNLDVSNTDVFKSIEDPSLNLDPHFDPQPAVQVPVVSTPTVLKTILGKKNHRLAKRVNFTDSSEVFYFPRSQGWVSVPKEGGNTLGMGDTHFHAELVPMMDQENWDSSPNLGNLLTDSYSDNDRSRALRPRKSARLSLTSTANPKKFLDTEDMSKKSPESETESKEWKSTLKKPGVIKLTRVSESKSLPIIAENEDHSFIEKSPDPVKSTRKCKNNRSFQVTTLSDSTLNSTADASVLNNTKHVKTGELGTRGLDRISSRKRKIILKSSGVEHLDPKEAEELKIIRENRGRVGCDCKGPCDPALCACAGGGIQCHQESPGSPCQCREGECGNPAGRYKFDPTKVQMHFIQTIMDTQGAFSIA
eukprot:TRINITY_DN14695_c0_g1_i1.p1 TRINITY_DN14695_c0_g1~~TRINITY_DN14695_c0_g1_i1.p1  ORF type:complete len:900 (-),score=249.42 TRINITY_DN14695_c0_g1_i1:139-2664(-)